MIEFRLPSLGADMDQGTLLEWHVKPGDEVARGQVVAVVDTAKAAIDVECWREGVVHSLLVEPGTRLPVGTPMAVLREPGESAEEVERALAARSPAAAPPAPESGPASTEPETPAAPSARAVTEPATGRRRISPLARRRARESGIDLDHVQGRGPGGAVTAADLEAPPDAPAAPAPATSRAGEMRRVIAAAMGRSKREIPHYYLAEEVHFGAAADWLAAHNRDRPPSERLLPAALLLKAVALALRRYPEFNGHWRDGGFAPAQGVHLGVAVSLRDGGLVAPALHDVPSLDLATLTRGLLDVVRRARAGALRSSELSAATATVTSLGDQGVAAVFGVIHPPQVALVGFGRIAPRAVVEADGTLAARPVVTATLAADHRASDGHRGALVLAEIRDRLQEPAALDDKGDPT